MFLSGFRHLFLVLTVAGILVTRAEAQLITSDDNLLDKFNELFPIDHSRPLTIPELCHRLDCLAEAMRDDGLIVLKQPDVFSQARLTRFRNDVDQQMSSDLGNFHLVLAARINRLDSATTTSTTALGAALAAPGTTNVQAPQANAASVLGTTNNLFSGGPSLLGTQPLLGQGAFGQLGMATNNFNPITPSSAASASALGLGVDPTVYLDEKKRFLEHLNQIRRINLGPDQNDSSGYGLYVVRLPVSITPGECTYQGYGADVAVSVEHEFSPDFLPSTFKNLVINDVVDQVGPVIYELIRSSEFDHLKRKIDLRYKEKALEAENEALLKSRRKELGQHFKVLVDGKAPPTEPEEISCPLTRFILRSGKPLTGDPDKDRPLWGTIADRLTALNDARAEIEKNMAGFSEILPEEVAEFKQAIDSVRRGEENPQQLKDDIEHIAAFVVWRFVLKVPKDVDPSKIDPSKIDLTFIANLYKTALPDDVDILDKLLALTQADRNVTSSVASNNGELNRIRFEPTLNKLALPAVRSAKQFYPIAPRELINFFLEENIYTLAKDAKDASRTSTIRAIDVRNYLRQTLETAYYAMAFPTPKAPGAQPPLANEQFMQVLLAAIHQREFGASPQGGRACLNILYDDLVKQLELSRENISEKPIGALCWAIAVDAAVLDFSLHVDARRTFETKGLPCDTLERVHFYYPKGFQTDEGHTVFCEYVRNRWPIITFALDPVTDQQNIADSFSLNRDLQLAVSYAFATGQINFSQLNTFRRQIQQSADTIALNRTVTGFVHSNDIFGFRFTPRFQNPPNQRTNIGVIASQLISGGPGPDYQTRKSKLEPGLRELTAVLLIPTFLPTMRMNIAGNWFKLNDPEHLVFHTKRMMERGRRVQELRQAAAYACSNQQYRDADLRVLHAKLDQLDAMLPMQSRVVQLPFENSANGFDLFSQGATALVPELTGFSGVDVITAPAAAAGGGTTATASGTTPTATTTASPATPPATFSVTTLASTNPPTTANFTIAGGTTSIGDVFVFGKYISLLDTRVIAGGRSASFEILSREVVHVQIPSNVIATTTEDGRTYIEIYLATPNGISNSLLIPYNPATPASPVAYDVATSSQSIDLYYQWLTGADGNHSLVATADPGKKGISISWDSNTGLGPRQIQAQFVATVNGQNVVLVLQATAGNKDDYAIDGQQFAVTLLKRLQDILVFPSLPPSPIQFAVSVQPWVPADSEGLRVRTKAKSLKSKVTVNLQYNDTGVNALPNVAPVKPSPPQPPAASATTTGGVMPSAAHHDPKLAAGRGTNDPALIRTAQQLQLPSPSPLLNAPQPPPVLNSPALLSPNVSSEAEQISKMLTGQPVPTTVSTPAPGSAAATAANLAAVAPPLTTQSTGQVPTILVNPSPVVVIPSSATPEKKKHTSRIHQMLNRLGNRVSQALPPQQPGS